MINKYAMQNKFDKYFKIPDSINEKAIKNLFALIYKFNITELRNYSLQNNISLSTTNKEDDNLIHYVVSIDDETVSETTRLHLIKFLVNENVNPDKPNKYNITPLHLACKKQYNEIVTYLLQLKCDNNFKDSFGQTPFHYLLSGKISKCKPHLKIEHIIKPSTKDDYKKIKEISIIKKDVWEQIKENNKIDIDAYLEKKTTERYDDSNRIPIYRDEVLKAITDIIKNSTILERDEINKIKDILKNTTNNILKNYVIEFEKECSGTNNKIQFQLNHEPHIYDILNKLNQEILNAYYAMISPLRNQLSELSQYKNRIDATTTINNPLSTILINRCNTYINNMQTAITNGNLQDTKLSLVLIKAVVRRLRTVLDNTYDFLRNNNVQSVRPIKAIKKKATDVKQFVDNAELGVTEAEENLNVLIEIRDIVTSSDPNIIKIFKINDLPKQLSELKFTLKIIIPTKDHVIDSIKKYIAKKYINLEPTSIDELYCTFTYKIIQELITDYIKERSSIKTLKVILQDLSDHDIDLNDLFNKLIPNQDYNFALTFNSTDIKIESIDSNKDIFRYTCFIGDPRLLAKKNLEEKKRFILYPEDYNTTNRLVQKLCLCIDKNIINELDKNNTLITIDNDGRTAIYSVLKYGYADVLLHFINMGYDLRDFYSLNNTYEITPCEFSLTNSLNHLQWLTPYNKDYNKNIKEFVAPLLNDLTKLILNNETYGNTIINFTNTSFEMLVYFVTKYLSHDTGNFEDINFVNYLTKLDKGDIDENEDSDIKIKKRLIKNTLHLNLINYSYQLRNNDNTVPTKIYDKIDELNREQINISYSPTDKVIKYYDKIVEKSFEDDPAGYLMAFKNFLKNNSNTEPLKLLYDDKEKLEDIKNNNFKKDCIDDKCKELNENLKKYKKIAIKCEKYFNTSDKTIKKNKTLEFTSDLLKHLTKNIMAYALENIIRCLIFTEIYNKSNHDTNLFDNLEKIMDYTYVFNKDQDGVTIPEYLRKEVTDLMVRTIANIPEDADDKLYFKSKQLDDILRDLFDLLEVNPYFKYTQKSKILQALHESIIPYMKNYISKLVNNWIITIEHIFKFFINQKRLLETFLTVINCNTAAAIS